MRMLQLLQAPALSMLALAGLIQGQDGLLEEPREGHSRLGQAFDEGPRQAAYLMSSAGPVHFPVSTANPELQAMFNQGVRQLHGYSYFEAERSFRQVAALEPDCALAYWGMAMANRENLGRAAALAHEAWLRREAGNERERKYVEAIAKLYGVDGAPPQADREIEPSQSKRLGFLEDLEAIVSDYPDDLEAKAFLVNEYWHGEGIHSVGQLRREALLQEILGPHPEHPAQHYRIHLWDAPLSIERLLEAAALVGPASPQIAHHWSMGAHVYDRLKRYGDAAWQQEAAIRVDHAQMRRELILPDQIHSYARNSAWLLRGLRKLGRAHEALQLAKNMIELPRHPKWNGPLIEGSSAPYGFAGLVETLNQFELWEEVLKLGSTPALFQDESQSARIELVSLIGKAQVFLRDELGLQASLEELSERALSSKRSDDRRAARESGALLASLNELLAGRSQAGLPAELSPGLIEGTSLACLLVDLGELKRAQDLARGLLRAQPACVLPLATLAYVMHKSGQREAASAAFGELRALSAGLDLDVRPLQRLAPLAASLGLPADWRVPSQRAKDLGPPVDLEQLGPAHWSPPAAPVWSALQPDGQRFESQSSGPRVLILFLGLGCVHCVEQLHAFAPFFDVYRRAGLDLVSIGDDTPEDLDQADVVTSYPFPVLSDANHDVFHAFRSFDDFEGVPLHGTFLLDSQDRMRWMDIGPEPFLDAQFLLEEAQRLLGLELGTPAAGARHR